MTESRMVIDSPVGRLRIGCDGHSITEIAFVDDAIEESPAALLREATRQLQEYFAEDRDEFDLPLDPPGTDFQRRVWTELRNIAYGQTASYGDIAKRLDLPLNASRAVGLANGSNPISIVIPCHRVIGADGSLTGYGGGLDNKRLLLQLEARGRGDTLF